MALRSSRWQTTNQANETRVYPSASAQQFKKEAKAQFGSGPSYGVPSPVKAPSVNSHWNMRGNAALCMKSSTGGEIGHTFCSQSVNDHLL
jgi:hypothetical protein